MKNRNSLLDNSKGMLIFLVVLGHYLVAMRGTSAIITWLIVLIYGFHMPAFLLINGFLAKSVTIKKISKFLLLYIIFQLVFMGIAQLSGYSQEIYFHFLNPIFHLWYLISLSLYYGMVLVLQKMRFKINIYFLIGTILLAFISRLVGTSILKANSSWLPLIYFLQRHFVFLPFFVVGYLLQNQGSELIEKGRKLKFPYKIGGIFLWLILATIPFINLQAFEYLVYSFVQSAGFSNSMLTYCLMFIYQYILAALTIIMLFVLIPKKNEQLACWGRQSLVIYLGHPFVYFLLYMFKDSFIRIPSGIIIVISIILSLITCYALSVLSEKHRIKQ